MPNNQQLHESINVSDRVTKKLIQDWNTTLIDLKTRGVHGVSDIEPSVALRYKYDFYGLLTFLGIEPRFFYPYLIVNGYTSPTQYAGDVLLLTRLDPNLLTRYYEAFTR